MWPRKGQFETSGSPSKTNYLADLVEVVFDGLHFDEFPGKRTTRCIQLDGLLKLLLTMAMTKEAF